MFNMPHTYSIDCPASGHFIVSDLNLVSVKFSDFSLLFVTRFWQRKPETRNFVDASNVSRITQFSVN